MEARHKKARYAAGFVTFAGVVVGPPSFAALAAVTHDYRTGFLILAAIIVAAASALHLRTPAAAVVARQ